MRLIAAVVLGMAVLVGGCGGDDSANETTTTSSTTTTVRSTTTTTEPTTTTKPILRYPSGDEVLPGYPLIVPVSTIDDRVASWFEGKLVDGQVVALAPGVYTPFNPAVPELEAYLDLGSDGDCAVRERYFPNTGGACWNGVQKGSAEP